MLYDQPPIQQVQGLPSSGQNDRSVLPMISGHRIRPDYLVDCNCRTPGLLS